MNREQILEAIKELAKSKRYYAKMLEDFERVRLQESEEDYEEIMTILENQNFKDIVDIVMFFETGDPHC